MPISPPPNPDTNMSELQIEIMELLENSKLTYQQIADKLQIPLKWVEAVEEAILLTSDIDKAERV